MFVAGVGNDSQVQIHEYSLSTGFDLSSGVTHLNTQDLISFQNHIDGVTFNYDGTKMYTITHMNKDGTPAQDLMYQFKLTTPYDVSTLSLEGTYTVSSVSKIQEKLCLVMMEVKCLSLMINPIIIIMFMNLT